MILIKLIYMLIKYVSKLQFTTEYILNFLHKCIKCILATYSQSYMPTSEESFIS